MRRGRREKPVISLASIEAALKAFTYNHRETTEAATLESLALVDLRLAQVSRPSAESLRTYTVQMLLAEFLQAGLNQQRKLFDLSPVSETDNRKQAELYLSENGAKPSPSLKAWSSIYYRYFRSDLGFSVEELATCLGYGAKQFGRYENEGLRLLRDKVIDAEWQARQLFLQRFLQRCIPEIVVPLIGREAAIRSADWAFMQNPPMPVFITGAEGIGKTALIADLAKRLIDRNALDYLVWLNRPKRIEEIYNALEDNLLPFPSRVDWRALLGEDTLLLVLDDISQLAMTSEEWEQLVGLLSPAYLIISNREYRAVLNLCAPIPLGELSLKDAETLIATYLPDTVLLNKVPLEEIGGNPRLLAYTAQQILAGYRPQKAVDGLRLMYGSFFDELSEAAQIAWTRLAAGMESHDDSLITKGLLTLHEGSYQLAASAKHYIMLRYANDDNLRKSFRGYLLENANSLSILYCDWLNLDETMVLQVLTTYEPKSKQEFHQWQRLTAPYLAEANVELCLRYGIALRRLALPEAEVYLTEFIQQSGQVGNFVVQALARYELAMLYQSQAKFEIALRDYEAIEAYLQKRPNNALAQNILLQRARIAIEAGDGLSALQFLQKRRTQEEADKILECEAYLLLGDTENSRSIAQKTLNGLKDNPQLAASLYTILGRSFQLETNSVKMVDHFNAALSLSEQFNSDFDIARAKTNLAAAYLSYKSDYFDETEALLLQAKRIQIRIEDRIGLNATEMNFSYLQRLRVSTYK
jgi:hypothetical protein